MTISHERAIGCPVAHHDSRGYGVDIADPTLYSDGDPHAAWTALRRHDPVSRHCLPGGQGYWSVTKYWDADRVLRDYDTFTSQQGTLLYLLGRGDPAGGHQMAATDPPRHTALREPLQRALAPKAIRARKEQIRGVVTELLDPLADGVYDLSDHMTRMPMAVAGVLMGLPAADWPRLAELTTMSVAPLDPRFRTDRGLHATLNAAHRELFAYFHDMVRHRRSHPGDDLISLLLRMEIDDHPLTAGDVTSNCYSLLLGANVTTAQVPVSAMAELMGTPALDDWADHRELLHSGVDEALRWATPTTHFIRYATRDATLRGRHIKAGEAVAVWLPSANRDDEAFRDPFTFDVRRRPNKHLAFGIGPHFCVGHTVAKVALRLVFAELFSRFTDFAPAGPGERLHSNTIYGWTRLPITARVRDRRRPVAY